MMYPYNEADYPRWCLVTKPEHLNMVIDRAHNEATLHVSIAEGSLEPDGIAHRLFFRTESLAIWYRRKHDLLSYVVFESDYRNWLRAAGGDPIYVVEGLTDEDIEVSLVSPE